MQARCDSQLEASTVLFGTILIDYRNMFVIDLRSGSKMLLLKSNALSLLLPFCKK